MTNFELFNKFSRVIISLPLDCKTFSDGNFPRLKGLQTSISRSFKNFIKSHQTSNHRLVSRPQIVDYSKTFFLVHQSSYLLYLRIFKRFFSRNIRTKISIFYIYNFFFKYYLCHLTVIIKPILNTLAKYFDHMYKLPNLSTSSQMLFYLAGGK